MNTATRTEDGPARPARRAGAVLRGLVLCAAGAGAVLFSTAAHARDGGPAPSAGCGKAAPVAAGASIAAELESGGVTRDYRLHLPAGYRASQPAPLVLVIHGYTGTAEQTENAETSFRALSDQNGFVAVFPQGSGFRAGDRWITSWNDGACSAAPNPAEPVCAADAVDYPTPPECGESKPCDWCSCHDDVAFVRELLDDIESRFCIDRNRVYATGISNGGMMVHRLGCDLPERFAAIAPVAGTLATGFNCAPGGDPPVSMMNIHSTGDTTVPFDGSRSNDGFFYLPVDEVIGLWASERSQNCAVAGSPYPTSADGVRGFECEQRAACASGAEVVNCSWQGGHDWPRDGEDDFASGAIWEFFSKNAR